MQAANLEGFANMNASQLLEVATQVFFNRDKVAQREESWKMQKKKKKKKKSRLVSCCLGGMIGWNAPGKITYRDRDRAKKWKSREEGPTQDQS